MSVERYFALREARIASMLQSVETLVKMFGSSNNEQIELGRRLIAEAEARNRECEEGLLVIDLEPERELLR
jgi:hypothetical protein